MFMRFSELRVGSFEMLTTPNRPQLPIIEAKTTHKLDPARRRMPKACEKHAGRHAPRANRPPRRNLQPNPKSGTLTLERTTYRKT